MPSPPSAQSTQSAQSTPSTTMTVATARRVMALTVVGVSAYVGSWLVSGWLIDGYDPMAQAISETFAIGAPTATRVVMTTALVATGVLLIAFGPALDRLAPGTGSLPMWTSIVSGAATVLVAAAPCTAGCPGFTTTRLDALHVVAASVGYVALIATPLATARRVWRHDPVLARTSLAMGTAAALLFVVATTIDLGAQGLVQRGYNTIADAWYVVAGVWLLRATADQADRT